MSHWTVKENPAWGKMLDVVDADDAHKVACFRFEDEARLGALAPEMREALKFYARLNSDMGYDEIEEDHGSVACAVLAKLEGQS